MESTQTEFDDPVFSGGAPAPVPAAARFLALAS